MALQRERAERRLAANNTARTARVNQKDYGTEALVDAGKILDQVLLAVPHVSGFPALIETGRSESFDENSYYSSKADSWSDKSKGDAADSDAMVLSDGEVSEAEFEPQYEFEPAEPAVPVADAYEPDQEIEEQYQPEIPSDQRPQWMERDEDYSPPAPVPTIRENYTNETSQLMQILVEQALPQTVAVNQIESPAAPQPSHISPLATGPMQDTFDQEPSSRSDLDQPVQHIHATKKGKRLKDLPGKGKKRKHLPDALSNKRRRVQRSPQSPEAIIKEEPMSPVPLNQLHLTPRRQRAGQVGEVPASGSRPNPQQPFTVPEGYRLVPIDEPTDSPRHLYTPAQPPPIVHYAPPQPVFRDANGTEFYDEPPPTTYRPAPVPVPRVYYDRPPPHYEQPLAPTAYYDRPPSAYVQHSQVAYHTYPSQGSHPYAGDPRPSYAAATGPPPARAGTAAPPEQHRAYQVVDRAYSVHPAAAATVDPYAEYGPPPSVQYTTTSRYVPPVQRAYSVHPGVASGQTYGGPRYERGREEGRGGQPGAPRY
jgi:hypothetical protein